MNCKGKVQRVAAVAVLLLLTLSTAVAGSGDSAGEATRIRLNQWYSGQVSSDNTSDWWLVQIDGNGILEATVRTAGGGGRIRVWLYHAERTGSNLTNSYLDAGSTVTLDHPTGPGTYLVRVGRIRDSVRYELNVHLNPPMLPMDPIDNHTPADAAPMSPNGSVTGNLGYYWHPIGAESTDWWWVDATDDCVLEISLRIPDAEGRARVWLYHPERTGSNFANTYVDGRNTETISFPVAADRYLVKVDRVAGHFSYELSNRQVRTLLPPDGKSNTSANDAYAVELNARATGNLGYYLHGTGTETTDWWRVQVPDVGVLHVALQIPDPQGRVRYWLYHEDRLGSNLANAYVNAGESESIHYEVTPGTYYVKVDRITEHFSYELLPTLTPVSLTATHTPAGDRDAARAFSIGEPVAASLGYLNQDTNHWWRIRVNQSGTLNVNAYIADPNSRMRLWIYEEGSGSNRANTYVDGESVDGFAIPVEAGVYEVRVDRISGYFSYLLSAGLAVGDGRPQVVGVYPADGSRDASRRGGAAALFDRELDSRSIDTRTVQLQDARGRSVRGRVAVNGSMVAFQPEEDLEPNSQYSLHISRSVKDTDGRDLGRDVSVSFTTAHAEDIEQPVGVSEGYPEWEPADDYESWVPHGDADYGQGLDALEDFIAEADQSRAMHPSLLEELVRILEQLILGYSSDGDVQPQPVPLTQDSVLEDVGEAVRLGILSDAAKQRLIRILSQSW